MSRVDSTVKVGALTLGAAKASSLSGVHTPTVVREGAAVVNTLAMSVSGTCQSSDNVYSVYDDAGHKLYSNENGGVWTRYFYDTQGHAVREVRFRWSDAAGNFLDAVQKMTSAPSQAELEAKYNAAVAASPAQDTLRVVTRTFNSEGQMTSETHETHAAYGNVTNAFEYDRYGNKTAEIQAQGAGQGIELRTDYRFDALNRLTQMAMSSEIYFNPTTGAFAPLQAEQRYGYDLLGNRSVEETRRDGKTLTQKRFHYGAGAALLTEWNGRFIDNAGALAGADSTQRVDYQYDSFGRLQTRTATDLRANADLANRVQTTSFTYTTFDQMATRTDADGAVTTMRYDRSGNLTYRADALGHAESFVYDAENRQTQKTDALGHVTGTTYDGFGHKTTEIDGNGRVTTYQYGAFGQVLSTTMTLTAPITSVMNGHEYSHQSGKQTTTQNTSYNWLGQTVSITDDYGRNDRYGYDERGQQVQITRSAQEQGAAPVDQVATFTFDARGRRVAETLTRGVEMLRSQTYGYNVQGWLTGVNTVAGGQAVSVSYQYDAAGNRTQTYQQGSAASAVSYTYDANNRMTSAVARDGSAGAYTWHTVESVNYDGFGNRASESRGGVTTTYRYDRLNRVVSSSAGDSWSYDGAGNLLSHTWGNGASSTTNVYDAANRTIESTNVTNGGSPTKTRTVYDAAGNVTISRTEANDYCFDEVSMLDVRYDAQSKYISGYNNWVRDAKYMFGDASFRYDVNGQMTFLDRGRPDGDRYNSVGLFSYDNEGHILDKSDQGAAASASLGQVWAFSKNPSMGGGYYSNRLERWVYSARNTIEAQLYGGSGNDQTGPYSSSLVKKQSYVYANGQPVGEVKREVTLSLKQLTPNANATPVYSSVYVGRDTYENRVTSHTATLSAAEVVHDGTGQVDRLATARNVLLHFYGASNVTSPEALEGLVAQIATVLPAGADVGTTFTLDEYLLVSDAAPATTSVVTDYAYQTIGGENGITPSAARSYTIRAGDTLKSIAASYYGSPSYWYLIADANGLKGDETLRANDVLTVPNVLANSVNDKETYKLYSKNEIIGSTSAVAHVQQKDSGWLQAFIAIVIVVIICIVAWWVAQYAIEAFGAAFGTATATGATLGAAVGAYVTAAVTSAAVGYAAMYATSYVTQRMAIAVGLQKDFDWKAMNEMGKSGAISALAAGIGSWAQVAKLSTAQRMAVQVGVAAGSQYARDGKITSVSGLLVAMIPGASKFAAESKWTETAKFLENYQGATSAGLSLLETSIRGQDQTMGWAGFASAAMGDTLKINTGDYFGAGGYNWERMGVEAVMNVGLASMVSDKYGTQGAANFFGNSLGSMYTGSKDAKIQYAKDVQTLPPELVASLLNQEGISATDKTRAVQDYAKALRNMTPEEQLAFANAFQPGGTAGMPSLAENVGARTRGMYDSAGTTAGTTMDAAAATSDFAAMEPTSDTYKVKKGDSLWSIAKQQLQTAGGDTSDAAVRQRTMELMQANPGIDLRKLKIDQAINLASGAAISDTTVNNYNADAQRQTAPAVGPNLDSIMFQRSPVATSAASDLSNQRPMAEMRAINGDGTRGLVNSYLGMVGLSLGKLGFGNSVTDSADVEAYRNTPVFGTGVTHGQVFDVTSTSAEVLGLIEGGLAAPKLAKSIRHWGIPNTALSRAQIDKIVSTPKGMRPDPSEYLSPAYISEHLAQFEGGATRFMTRSNLEKYGIGQRDGTAFVMPKQQADELIASANGNMQALEESLGLPKNALQNTSLVRVDIPKPSELNLRIPSGNEAGANALWIPGGRLPNGNLEAVMDVGRIPSTRYDVTGMSDWWKK